MIPDKRTITKLVFQTEMLMRKYQHRLWVGRADRLPKKTT